MECFHSLSKNRKLHFVHTSFFEVRLSLNSIYLRMVEVIPEPGTFAKYPDGITKDYVDLAGKKLNDQK